MVASNSLLPVERIRNPIYMIRNQSDRVVLYGVDTRVLNQAVRRNKDLFPADFLVSLTRAEIRNISQSVISSEMKHARNVFAFAEQGVARLNAPGTKATKF